MNVLLDRKYPLSKYSIGKFYLDGVYFCDTLEDPDRGLTSTMTNAEISSKKVYGNTAIPKGTYEVEMGVVSPKFENRSWAKRWGGKIPRLKGVPGFVGVLIHPGTTALDTEGCILVGLNKEKGKVLQSQDTFNKLMEKLVEAWYRGEKITLTIK